MTRITMSTYILPQFRYAQNKKRALISYDGKYADDRSDRKGKTIT